MSNATRDLTGQIALAGKKARANQILNEFLDRGSVLLHEKDLLAEEVIDEVLEEISRARQEFDRYGIEIKPFLEEGEVR